MFTVATQALTTALTTLAAVKTALNVKDTTSDAWLTTQIGVATQVVVNYLGAEMAEDGTRNLGRETIVETLDRRSRYPWNPPFGVVAPRREADTTIVLAKRPVISIASITENGTAVDPGDYLLSAAVGTVRRLSSGLPTMWPTTLVVVTYTAGWRLPADNGRTLPLDIEQAVIELVQAQWFGRDRDPNIKSEIVTGVRQVDYFFGTPGIGDGGIPDITCTKLNPYRNISL